MILCTLYEIIEGEHVIVCSVPQSRYERTSIGPWVQGITWRTPIGDPRLRYAVPQSGVDVSLLMRTGMFIDKLLIMRTYNIADVCFIT